MDETLHITVSLDEDSLFGYEPAEGYTDVKASIDKYCDLVRVQVTAQYPGAKVAFVEGQGAAVLVDGMADHPEIPWIEQTVENVWSAWEWLVEALPDDVEDASSAADVNTVDPAMGCPQCGCVDMDQLVWMNDVTIHCYVCGTEYQPGA